VGTVSLQQDLGSVRDYCWEDEERLAALARIEAELERLSDALETIVAIATDNTHPRALKAIAYQGLRGTSVPGPALTFGRVWHGDTDVHAEPPEVPE